MRDRLTFDFIKDERLSVSFIKNRNINLNKRI